MSIKKLLSRGLNTLVLSLLGLILINQALFAYGMFGSSECLRRSAIHSRHYIPLVGGLGHDDFIVLNQIGNLDSIPILLDELCSLNEDEKINCIGIHLKDTLVKITGLNGDLDCSAWKNLLESSNSLNRVGG